MDQSHTSVGTVPPSIFERESDPDEDDDPTRGSSVMTSEAFAEDEQVPLSEVDECPECGDEFDGMVQHMSQAHPDAYADYTEE